MKIQILIICLCCVYVLWPSASIGEDLAPCPPLDRIPDYNCDGQVVVPVLGDSLVHGTGDGRNNGQGGYVLRADRRLNNVSVLNFGTPGARSRDILDKVGKAFTSGNNSELKSALLAADIVVIDLGRNDRWLFGPAIATYRNLKRIRTQLKNRVAQIQGYPPLVVLAVLMLPNRGSQAPWVQELNGYILRGHSLASPSDLRFDLVSKRLLSADQIHPTSEGYDALAKVFLHYLRITLPPRMRVLRPDSDNNGIPDIFE